ncbi:HtaA domain-containing protein [Phenylobacterium sp.]|jgi:hypothetical protein|uniref:HtaA domain-containing protein n=1 Tax=Phenylobacterium sp. TaxID=1871053 RepID=UPI0037C6B594
MTDSQLQPVTALHWGVKTSFRGYVAMMGGVTEVGGGADIAPDGGFTFAAAPDSDLGLAVDGSLTGQGRFLGEVRFEAHGGMLKVFLADPAIEISETGAVLTVADSAARTRRVEIAKLDLAAITGGEPSETLIPASLTMDGSFVLGDHYPPTTALDPARLTVAAR